MDNSKRKLQKIFAQNKATNDQVWATLKELEIEILFLDTDKKEYTHREMVLLRFCALFVKRRFIEGWDDEIKDIQDPSKA